MATLSRISAQIRSVDPGYPAPAVEVQQLPSPSTGPKFDLDFLAGAQDQIWPTRQADAAGGVAPVAQVVFARLSALVPGQGTVTTSEFPGGFEVSTLVGDEGGQRWRFDLPATDEGLPFGRLLWPQHYQGQPPPGACGDLTIDLVYVTADQEEVVCTLLRGGIPTSGPRTIDVEDIRGRKIRHVLQISGIGPEGQLDLQPITYQLGAAHGKTHGTMIGEGAVLGGLAATEIDIGAELGYALNSPLDVADGTEQAWALLQEIARGASHWLRWAGPNLAAVPIAPIDEEPVVAFTAADLVLTGMTPEDPDASAPTLVRVISSETKRDPDADGTVTVKLRREVFGPLTIRAATHYQLTPLTPPPYVHATGWSDATFDVALVQETIRERTTRNGCEILVRTTTKNWRNIESWRYKTDTGGVINQRAQWVYIFDSAAVDDDDLPAFVWPTDKFVVDTIDEEQPVYDTDGREIQRIYRQARWSNLEEARKQSSLANPDWPSENFFTTEVLGSQKGVELPSEYFFEGPNNPTDALVYGSGRRILNWFATKTIDRQADAANLMKSQTTTEEGYARRSGKSKWYADGTTSRDIRETGVVTRKTVETYEDGPEGSYYFTSEARDKDNAVPENGVISDTIQGGRPGIPICTQELIDLGASQEVVAERSIPAGTCRAVREHEEIARFAEGEDGAADLADALLRWYTAPLTVFVIPAAAPIHDLVGKRATVDFPWPIGIQGDGWINWVRTYTATGEDGRPQILTEIGFRRRLV